MDSPAMLRRNMYGMIVCCIIICYVSPLVK
jgi:hypothetical protein